MNSVNLRDPSSKQEETMTDLNMFRASQQSRRIIEEEFTPRVAPRLADGVLGTKPKHLSARLARRVTIIARAK